MVEIKQRAKVKVMAIMGMVMEMAEREMGKTKILEN